MQSAKIFAERIPSDTRKKNNLLSTAKTTLGKIMALGIPNSLLSAEKRSLGKLGKTLGKTETRQKTVMWTSVS